jgi:hypothetical protein
MRTFLKGEMNNDDNHEIQDLLLQLKQLQLEQTRLQQKQTKITTRLERLSKGVDKSEGVDNANKKEDAKRKFAVGERVRIINPGPSQATTGYILKIGTSRITVQTRSGDKIVRAAKNLITED